jgi:2',3'-cyclic-nucleotide 2'-phosphodiesterase (5'-nucleotidase family)
MNKTLLIVVVLLALTACSVDTDNDIDNNADQSGLTFIHLNDTYRIGDVESGNAGGFGRVVTVVRALKAQGRDVRILHGGDFLFPSLESQ